MVAALVPFGARQAAAQTDEGLRTDIGVTRHRLSVLEATLIIVRSYEAEMRAGSRVAVAGGGNPVFMTRAALRGSLQRRVIQAAVSEWTRNGDYESLAVLADAARIRSTVDELEREALEESDAFFNDWVRKKAAIEAEMDFNRGLLQRLEDELRRGTGGGAAAPPPGGTWEDLRARKRALGLELDNIRKAGQWLADHHMQVGTLIGNALTSAQLNRTETLMHDYEECYRKKNTDRAAVLEAARAGRYPTPSDRIAELDRVQATFDGCMGTAISTWRAR